LARAKRIFMIADFKDEHPRSIRYQPRMWVKGLIRNGMDVQQFSYRNIMIGASLFSSKRFALRFSKKKTDEILIRQIKKYYPDIVLVYSMKYVDAETVRLIRQACPGAIIAGRDEDPFPCQNPERLAIAKELDIVVNSSAGKFLQTYKDLGVKCCAFLPDMCDPDIQYKYDVDSKWDADIIFTGKAEHSKLDRNNERFEIVTKLQDIPGSRIYGSFGIPRVEAIEYFYAISGAKIGLSINIANDVELYHSDRLMNYTSCGTCVLAKRVPRTELLFRDKEEVVYFDTTEDFVEKAKWYLANEQERLRIARAGMERTHKEYNCTKMTRHFLEIAETGTYKTPWSVIL